MKVVKAIQACVADPVPPRKPKDRPFCRTASSAGGTGNTLFSLSLGHLEVVPFTHSYTPRPPTNTLEYRVESITFSCL